MKSKRALILLVVIGIIVYFPSLFGRFLWDDEDFVYENQAVKTANYSYLWSNQSLAGRGKASDYYRPIQFSIYAALWTSVGNNPAVFHLISIMVHIGAACAAYYMLLLFEFTPLTSFCIALLFLIHPIQTESVSYISGLSDPLYALFMFTSVSCYILKKKRSYYLLLSIVFLVLSLLSKEFGLVTICLLFLYEFFFAKKTDWKNDVSYLVIMGGLGAFYLLIRTSILEFYTNVQLWGNNSYGTRLDVRLATFCKNFFSYLQVALFPHPLFMERDFVQPVVSSFFSFWTIFFISFVVFSLWGIRHFGKRALFLYCCFLVSLIPIVGIVPLNGIFYEHYMYVPLLFLWGCIVVIGQSLLPKKEFIILFTIVSLLFVCKSISRQYDWISPERLYRQTLSFAPKSVRILNNLGMTLAQNGNYQEALQTYDKAIAIDPTIPNMYHNKGNAYASLGKKQQAIEMYRQALRVDPGFTFSQQALEQMK